MYIHYHFLYKLEILEENYLHQKIIKEIKEKIENEKYKIYKKEKYLSK